MRDLDGVAGGEDGVWPEPLALLLLLLLLTAAA